MTGRAPLLAPRDPEAPFAWQSGRPVSARRFLADVEAQAGRLPDEGRAVINLCTDRYRFTVLFAAALRRGRRCLLPPDALPATLERLGGEGTLALGDADVLLDDGDAVAPVPPCVRPSALSTPTVASIPTDFEAACLLTSGSTGDPQPHAKRWGQLVDNIAAERDRLADHLGRPDLAGLTIVATVPPQHSYGFESSVLLALLGGAAIDAGRPYFPADVAEALARVPRPRALVTTPFHLKNVLAAGLELPPVDLLVSATAPLSPQLAQQAERAFGGPLIEIYGCTEAGQVATRRSVETELWTCYGALTVHAEPGDERYLVSGGHVVGPTPLADVLELQDERRFRLLGRAGDLIHVAGRRTSIAHLDYQLNAVEGVEDAAVWMPRDVADGVARPVAFVVAPTLSAADIRHALRGRLEAVFIPRRIVKLDRLPREATGKLKASQLDRLAATHAGARR